MSVVAILHVAQVHSLKVTLLCNFPEIPRTLNYKNVFTVAASHFSGIWEHTYVKVDPSNTF